MLIVVNAVNCCRMSLNIDCPRCNCNVDAAHGWVLFHFYNCKTAIPATTPGYSIAATANTLGIILLRNYSVITFFYLTFGFWQ